MPNWVMNEIAFECDDETLAKIKARVGTPGMPFDFNAIVPMPEELDMPEGSKSAMAIECFCASNEDEISAVKEKYHLSEEVFHDNIAKGMLYARNIVKYGHATWYGWHIDHWGTKWNSREAEWSGNTVRFRSAWAAPGEVLFKLSRLFPEVEFTVDYADEHLGRNCGSMIFGGGTLKEDIDETGNLDFAKSLWGIVDEDEEE